jgi:DNA-binding NarL/FixJ family response regulator
MTGEGFVIPPLETEHLRVYSEEDRAQHYLGTALRLEHFSPVAPSHVPHLQPFDRAAHAPKPARRTSWTADELLAETFPEPRWAVPGILAEGLNLLAGAPKLGKSWFALNLAVAVAAGGKALGHVDVEAGDVLHVALEDPARRMKDRLRKVLAGSAPSPRLTVSIECPPIPNGGAERIGAWCDARTDARLVVVDVFARVRGKSDPRTDRYEADYHAAGALKDLADRHGVAVLLVHHTRKQDASDWIDSVSGTQGLAGAADAVLVLTRARNTRQAVLKLTGRDVAEAEYAMELDASLGLWTMLDGPAADLELSEERRRIVAAVRDTEGLGPKQIAEATGLSHDVVKQLVRRMVDAGQIDTDGAGHYLPPFTPFTPFTEGQEE